MIERRGWRHDRFLLIVTLLLLIALLSYAVILLGLTTSGRIDQGTLQFLLQNLGMWLLGGLITGILIGFLLLVRPYRRQQWDLHKVVPTFLINFVLIFLTLLIIEQFMSNNSLYQSSFNIGVGIGGMIPIIAYSAEVAKEHPEFL